MIQNDKIRAVIAAGIKAKKHDPRADFTPASYMRLEKYIVDLEMLVLESGRSLPKVL